MDNIDMKTKHRDWIFTWYGWDDDAKEYIKGLIDRKKPSIRYVCYGQEICPTTGRPHLQGYIYFDNAVVFKTVKSVLGNHHIEPSKTKSGHIKYCAKTRKCDREPNEVFVEHGDPPDQGARNDLLHMKEMIDEGAGDLELYNEHFGSMIRYNRGMREYRRLLQSKREEPARVWWLYGDSGTGKTAWVHHMHKDSVYIKDRTKWWDGYKNEEALLIDDLKQGDWEDGTLLRLLDRYAFTGEVKGGHVNVNSPYIYITCDTNPNVLWSGKDLVQILRRLDKVYKITIDGPIDETVEIDNTLPWFLRNTEVK